MKFKDCFKLALNSILNRKLRSWLTLLGVIIGVAAVVSIISIGEGAQASVEAQLSSFGADTITITPGASRGSAFGGDFRMSMGGGGAPPRRTSSIDDEKEPILTPKDSMIIKANENVLVVSELVSARANLVFLSEENSVSVTGINPVPWKEMTNLTLDSGRFLSASDSSAIVIGYGVANTMFKQPIVLGRTIQLGKKNFNVVGILSSSGSSFGGGNDNSVYVPLNSIWNLDDVSREKDTYTSVQAKVSDVSLVEETTDQIDSSLLISRRVTEKTKDFTVTSSLAIKEQVSSVTDTLTIFLAAIATVSLIVGAVGVANSMFTSVLEKTRLIGILKALGATKHEVMLLFVIESGLFGLIGGIIGVIIGIIISMLLSSIGLIGLPMMGRGMGGVTFVSPMLIVSSILISTIIGILSGVLPAKSASELKPIEALRYE